MNRYTAIGRWAKEIDLRYTNEGTPVAGSTIAIDEGYGDKKKTHFFNVVMWKKTAETTAQYSGKGKKVAIEGRLQQRSWDKDGVKQYVVEIVAEQVEFLEPKDKSAPSGDPFQDDGKPIDISSDDLPF